MSIIYETRGRAKEYFELAANLYSGCSHSCLYCFGPDILHTTQGTFYKNPTAKDNVIHILDHDARRLAEKHETRPVLLSFVSDPYQLLDVKLQVTRKAIEVLKSQGLPVAILTKGGLRATRDFDLLEPGRDMFGVTLVMLAEERRKKWEPGAAPAVERVRSLAMAKERDLKTFLSLEPIIFLDDALEIIRLTHNIVDIYKCGKLNYHPKAKEINWKDAAGAVIGQLEDFNASYYIKKDLAQYVGKPEGITKRISKFTV